MDKTRTERIEQQRKTDRLECLNKIKKDAPFFAALCTIGYTILRIWRDYF